MLASPTSLAFKLGAHFSGVNVVISSQSSMASSNANHEILPSSDGATFGAKFNPEAASHQVPMHNFFLSMSHSVGQSVISSVSFQGLVKSVLPTTSLRYHFLWVCPGDLRISISTKAAHATPCKGPGASHARIGLLLQITGGQQPAELGSC